MSVKLRENIPFNRIDNKAQNSAFVGKYKGKRVFRFHVIATVSGISYSKVIFSEFVIANTAADAMWHIRREVCRLVDYSHPIEVETRGIKGGKYHQFIGWHSLIGEGLSDERERPQRLQTLAMQNNITLTNEQYAKIWDLSI